MSFAKFSLEMFRGFPYVPPSAIAPALAPFGLSYRVVHGQAHGGDHEDALVLAQAWLTKKWNLGR